MNRRCAWLALLCVWPAFAQQSQFYRWKDADGTTHYSQTPPPGEKPSVVKVQGGADPMPATPTKATDDHVLGKAEDAARARNCDNARANLAVLSGGAMLVDHNDPASARRLTAEEREEAKRRAMADVDTYCGAAP